MTNWAEFTERYGERKEEHTPEPYLRHDGKCEQFVRDDCCPLHSTKQPRGRYLTYYDASVSGFMSFCDKCHCETSHAWEVIHEFKGSLYEPPWTIERCTQCEEERP